ncbi:MAG: ATP-binding protein [Clostridia bacterium]|nr:ATP-binding protein [Clostridia bacterium]
MYKKLVRQMLTAQILSALTVSLCLLIDNIVIGRFLGVDAIAAYGLANPVLLIIAALASMLSAGVQVVCSRSLGRGDMEGTNRGYSTAIITALAIAIPFALLVLFLRQPLATLLGAGESEVLMKNTTDYMAGFVIGAPASMGALILVPFLQIAGKSTLLIAAVGGMTVADIALDLLSVHLKGGMFGMGLASSLSYYIALLIGIGYFLSKKCVFKFSFKYVKWKTVGELFKGGIPSIFNMASTVILIFALNNVLMGVGGAESVAAFSVITTIGNSSNSVTTGISGVALTLMSMLYQEEDRKNMSVVAKELAKFACILGLAVGLLLFFMAPLIVKLFIADNVATAEMAALGIRLFAAGIIPSSLNGILKNTYQAIGHPIFTEIISICEGAVFPTLIGWILSIPFGATGVWFYFLAGELVTLVGVGILCLVKMKRNPFRDQGLLLLDPDFSVKPEEMVEVRLSTLEEVSGAAESIQNFCLSHGATPKAAYHVSLCVEEMSNNVILHGFTKDEKKHALFVLVLHKDNRWVIRFRDDCTAFDPLHYVPGPNKQNILGIRLALAIADDVSYTHSLDLNNLAITIRNEALAKSTE